MDGSDAHRPTRVLIIIENVPLQRDMRVRRQCRALLDDGYEVSVICPADDGQLPDELAAVRLWTWRSPPEPSGVVGFAREYLTAFVMVAWLSVRARLRDGFDIIQACNPPDFFFIVAMAHRWRGVRFVFDHHDLSPELFTARFGRRHRILLRLLLALERGAVHRADVVLATNESVRTLDIERGGAAPDDVVLVRNGPGLDRGVDVPPAPGVRNGRRHLCVWHGVMGSVDDGLDLALLALRHLVIDLGRHDLHLALVGDGEAREEMEALARELCVGDWVSFPGWLDRVGVDRYLATADLALAPDPKTPRLDLATSMKIMEFMAFELPIVAFDVRETRVSAGDAAVYVAGNDPGGLAEAIDRLLDDPESRRVMGKEGRRRLEDGLSWDHQASSYLEAVRRVAPVNGRSGGHPAQRRRRASRQRGGPLLAKRLMDVGITLLLLPIAVPVILLFAALVRLSSPGPAFFRSERVGRDGKPITVLKLRTMWADADDSSHRQYVRMLLADDPPASVARELHKVTDDARVTPIGRVLRRTSLDELPQLFNVLGGQMSLVGPRPDVPYAVEHYESWQTERFDVLPGITGLWQVSGRAALSPKEMLTLDVDYVRNWSLGLDLRILARTIGVVVRQVGAA